MTGASFFKTLLLTAAVVVAMPARAQETADRRVVLEQVETYFNGIDSMRADFMQSSSTGAFAEGKMYLKKENKLRLDYKPPAEIEVVADGHYLIFHDKKLGQVTHMDLASNPAAFILKKGFTFADGELTVTDVTRDKSTVEMTVFKTKEPGNGRITLIFSAKPFALKQWQVTDAQQVKTMVTLSNVEENTDIDDAVFKFKDPKKDLKPGDKGYKKRR